MALISLTSTTSSGMQQGDHTQIKGALQDGTIDISSASVTASSLTLGATAITATGAELNYCDGVTSNIQTQLDAKSNELVSFDTTSGSYTLLSTDLGKHISVSAAGTITLPNGLDTGFTCTIENTGTGTVTLSATTTLNTKESAVNLANQYGAVTVIHKGSNVWHAFGDLS